MAFHQPFVFLTTLLVTLVAVHFQNQESSPVETHFAMILLLIMAAVVYSIAFARINVQPHNSEYFLLFRLMYLASGILTCELLVGLLISPFWWFIVNICTISVEILRRWHQPIDEYLYRTTNLVLTAVAELFQHTYQFVCWLHDWLRQKFQSLRFAASQAFSLAHSHGAVEQENGGTRVANVV